MNPNLSPGSLYRVCYSPTDFEYVLIDYTGIRHTFPSLKRARLVTGAPLQVVKTYADRNGAVADSDNPGLSAESTGE